MKCLVVIAHPLEDSLCKHLAKETISHMESKGYDVSIKDLYNEEFNPVLQKDERQSYYANEFDQSKLQDDIKQLKQTESLVLVFPTWWFSFPAILKGWFDRVWAPSHAYAHADDLGAIRPLLTNLKEVNVVTTLGAAWWVDAIILRKPVEKVIKYALVGACAPKAKFKMLSLYRSESLTDKKINKFITKIKSNF